MAAKAFAKEVFCRHPTSHPYLHLPVAVLQDIVRLRLSMISAEMKPIDLETARRCRDHGVFESISLSFEHMKPDRMD